MLLACGSTCRSARPRPDPLEAKATFQAYPRRKLQANHLRTRGLPHSHEAKLMSPLFYTAVLTSCCLTTHRGTLARRQDCEDCMRGASQVHVSPTMTVFPI